MGEFLKGKVAVVTGGGGGIGREICMLMAKEGARVVVNDYGTTPDGSGQSTSTADKVVADIVKDGGVAVPNYDSVASWQGGENIIKTAVNKFGRIDILVNNAGVLRDRMIFNMSEQEWDIVIKTHLYGSFYCTRHATALMREQKYGRLVFTSSNASYGVSQGQANYGSAKAGMLCLSSVCANSLAKYGVTSNAIFPHADTRMTLTEEARREREKHGLGGGGPGRDPRGVAPMVVFLSSDSAANITGQVFDVSGSEISLYSWPLKPVKTIFGGPGIWTVEDLANKIPNTLAKDLVKPASSHQS